MKKNGKGRAPKPQQAMHLIQQITGGKPAKEETKEEEEVFECKYGIFCAHLRSNGECSFPHRRFHYLLLNLVPPANHLPDLEDDENEEEGKGKLSKRERKERKIMEKTISQHIDVAALTKQEQINKETAEAEVKQKFLLNMNEVERQVADVVTSQTAEEYFGKLNEARKAGNIFELRKRSMIQLKKKSEKTHADIIDKEYRIANRLIKESAKDTKHTLLQIYQDINHNTIPSVREYFEAYLRPEQGILQENPFQKYYLSKILHSIFLRETAQFEHPYCLIHSKSGFGEIASNAELYNLMVPFLHAQGQPFSKYLLLDCIEDLSLTSASQLLSKDYALTFHVKCKPAPEFPFGQLPSNIQKFSQWASKICSKYRETNKDSKVVLILKNIEGLFVNQNAQQFEQEKLRERRETFGKLITILQPVIYFLRTAGSEEERARIDQLLESLNLGKGGKTKDGLLHIIKEK